MYDNKYCVILDIYRDAFPYDWAITTSKNTLPEAEAVGFFDHDPDQVPRSNYTAIFIKSTTLIYIKNPNYGRYQGGIYLMQKI